MINKVLKGFRYLTNPESQQKLDIISTIQKVVTSYQFEYLETPTINYATDSDDKQNYRFKDNGDRDVMLRFDNTIPFINYIENHKKTIKFPYRRYSIGNVFRAENPQLGRYREFTQFDVDVIGQDSLFSNLECIKLLYDCMCALGIEEEITIKISDRVFINIILKYLNLTHKTNEIIRILDKKTFDYDTPADGFSRLRAYGITLIDQISKMYPEAKEVMFGSPIFEEIDRKLTSICEIQTLFENSSITTNLRLYRGLDYYTGAIFETYINNYPEIGSIASGGNYTIKSITGTGFAIGIDRLLAATKKLKNLKTKTQSNNSILLVTQNDDYYREVFNLSTCFRKNNIANNIYVGEFKKGCKYAYTKGYAYTILLGFHAFNTNRYNLTNISTRTTSVDISFIDIVNKFKEKWEKS